MANTVTHQSAIRSVQVDAQRQPLDAQLAFLEEVLIRAANASPSERDAILKPWRKAKPVGRPRTRFDESEAAFLESFESFRAKHGFSSDKEALRIFYDLVGKAGRFVNEDKNRTLAKSAANRISIARGKRRSSRK